MKERDQNPKTPEQDPARLLSPVDIVETFAEIYAAARIDGPLGYAAPNARYDWAARDGLIVDCAEHHDAAMVAAFLNDFAGEPRE